MRRKPAHVVTLHASGSQWRVARRDWQASHRRCCHWYWRVFPGTPLCAHSVEVRLLCYQADASARPVRVHLSWCIAQNALICVDVSVQWASTADCLLPDPQLAPSCCYVQADVTRALHRQAVLETEGKNPSLGRIHCLT